MFVGNPPGNYDRILDLNRAVTGNLFFVPPSNFLDDISEDTPEPTPTLRNWSLSRPLSAEAMARSALVRLKEKTRMNNLHRELAQLLMSLGPRSKRK